MRDTWVFACWTAAEGHILVVACRFVAETKQQQLTYTQQLGQRYPPDFWTSYGHKQHRHKQHTVTVKKNSPWISMHLICIFQIPLTLFNPKTTPPEYPTLPSTQMARTPTTLMMCWRNQVRAPMFSLNPGKVVIEWRIYWNNLAFPWTIVRPAKSRQG